MLAKRFLLSKSHDRFLSFITGVSVSGVALGVLALTVVTSVINGFEDELRRAVTAVNGDVVLYTRGNPVNHPETILQRIRQIVPEAQGLTESFVTELMVSGSKGVAGAVLEGINQDTVGEATEVSHRLSEGRMPQKANEVVVGKALAERLGLHVGDSMRLIAPMTAGGEGQKLGAYAPQAEEALVTGIVQLGMYKYDSKFVYATLASVQHFLNQPEKVTSFRIRLPGNVDSGEVASRLYQNFGYPFVSKNWAQLNRNLFYAVKLEKAVITVILTAIVLVAVFNVVSTLIMMIHEKAQAIAILKAMGFRRGQGFGLFCLIGTGIGVVGTGLGLLGGLGLNELIRKKRWIELPADIYHINFLPVVERWTEIAMIAGFSIFLCFLATLVPAIRVSMKSPLDGLRNDS